MTVLNYARFTMFGREQAGHIGQKMHGSLMPACIAGPLVREATSQRRLQPGSKGAACGLVSAADRVGPRSAAASLARFYASSDNCFGLPPFWSVRSVGYSPVKQWSVNCGESGSRPL